MKWLRALRDWWHSHWSISKGDITIRVCTKRGRSRSCLHHAEEDEPHHPLGSPADWDLVTSSGTWMEAMAKLREKARTAE